MKQNTTVPIHSSSAGVKGPPVRGPVRGLEALRRILRPAVF